MSDFTRIKHKRQLDAKALPDCIPLFFMDLGLVSVPSHPLLFLKMSPWIMRRLVDECFIYRWLHVIPLPAWLFAGRSVSFGVLLILNCQAQNFMTLW
jgi:hypothetical protein